MPSHESIPSLQQMLRAYAVGARGVNRYADVREGSIHDLMAGMGALCWLREMQRDAVSFSSRYLDYARGADLSARIVALGGPVRTQATRGIGTATFSRASGTAGTIWAGTRIKVVLGAELKLYRVREDTAVANNQITKSVPIESLDTGPGSAFSSATSSALISVDDSLWDNTWSITALTCADGAAEELDAEYLARYRQSKVDARTGYYTRIADACTDAGATYVALFESDSVPVDSGINRCFVANAEYAAPASLINACKVALDAVRVAGCPMTVFGIGQQAATFALTVQLWKDPGNYNLDSLTRDVKSAVAKYFSGRENPYLYSRDGVRGEIMLAIPDAQVITFGPTDLDDITLSSLLGLTEIQRITVDEDDVSVTFEGPSE